MTSSSDSSMGNMSVITVIHRRPTIPEGPVELNESPLLFESDEDEEQGGMGFDVSGAHQANEAKADSKDGGESGVEVRAAEMHRDDQLLKGTLSPRFPPVGQKSIDYVSGFAEDDLQVVASNEGSIQHHQHSGAEGTSEAAGGSSTLAGSLSAMQDLGCSSTSASRRLNTGSISSTTASTAHTNRRELSSAR
ncbi:hypothetical protein QAD02_010203 [Eretmocerus hayati]|uniref:Uncharacterized protein n=1 Tax=Eretmocerus hayati TaxID=131215 RepID=A0ACC2NBK8_9HYME|nr:hypothetical protein QAD02_010203 [Eretmocerus hayati]